MPVLHGNACATRYNRGVKLPLVAAALGMSMLLFNGCKNNSNNQEAVRQGIQSYLSKRGDLLAMDVNVTDVKFRQDEATATVHFQAKGNSSPGASLTMDYVLERKGSQWIVKGRSGANAHGSPGTPGAPQQGELPPGHPSTGGAAPPGGSIGAMPALPQGHPSTGGADSSGGLPAGHPPLTSDSKSGKKK